MQVVSVLRKDLLLQWRTRGQFLAVFVFGATAMLLFSFAAGPDSAALRVNSHPTIPLPPAGESLG